MTHEQLALDAATTTSGPGSRTDAAPGTFERLVTITDSSVITHLAYSPTHQVLRVRFTSGSLFEYAGVWPSDFAAIVSAHSVGAAFNARIRDRYPASRIAEVVDKHIPAKKARNASHRHA